MPYWSQRTRDIGIRRALEAQDRGILGVIMRRGIIQVATGIALGVASGWVLLGLMRFILTGTSSDVGLLAATLAP